MMDGNSPRASSRELEHSGKLPWLTGCAAAVLALIAYSWHTEAKYRLASPPSLGGDSIDYDSLGWELAHGRGFQTNFDRADFREAYRNEQGRLPDQLPHGGPRPIAYRPPLYPWALSLTNRLFGRQWTAGRMINIIAMSLTCGLLVGWAARLFGLLPALIAGVHFVAVDWRTRLYAREFLTEALAILLIALLTLLLMKLRKRPGGKLSLLAGALIGLAILDRSIIVLWTPVLAVFLWRWETTRLNNRFQALTTPLLFLLGAALTVSPWAFYNCRRLGRFMPLGTQGLMELSAGYSDAALQNRGLWSNQNLGQDARKIVGDATGLEREKRLAQYSAERAARWIAQNWEQLPLLILMKLAAALKPWGIGELYISAFALIGLIACRKNAAAQVGLAILAACLFSIAVTWSTAGRFLMPTLFVLHLFAAAGLFMSLHAAIHSDGRLT